MRTALLIPKVRETFFGRDLLRFSQKIKSGNTILDIGAYLGGSTFLFAQAVGKFGKVIAFEPVHFQYLKWNLRPYRFSQISLCPLALGANSGKIEFLIPLHQGAPLYSQSGVPDSYAPDTLGPEYRFLKIPGQLTRLDDFLEEKNIDPNSIDAVKIDVEGSELAVLQGGEQFFKGFKGFLMCEFWFNQIPPPGWIWLMNHGYHCRYLTPQMEWLPANSVQELEGICRNQTYGNFFFEKSV